MSFPRQLRGLILLLCLLLVSGCASKLPSTVPVSGPDKDMVLARLNRFLDQSCVEAIDSDVRLGWSAYGKEENYPATLLAAFPGYLRFAVVDPLGRSLLMLVINGNTFTLADNREGVGHTGRLDSEFIRQYLPEGISGDDLFYWISGQFRKEGLQVLSVSRVEEGELYWYEIDYGDRLRHLIALERNLLSRHLVLDEEDTVIFDVLYSGYSETPEDCKWPRKIEVTGKALSADFKLNFNRFYGFSPLQEELFELELPPHFMVHKVN